MGTEAHEIRFVSRIGCVIVIVTWQEIICKMPFMYAIFLWTTAPLTQEHLQSKLPHMKSCTVKPPPHEIIVMELKYEIEGEDWTVSPSRNLNAAKAAQPCRITMVTDTTTKLILPEYFPVTLRSTLPN